MRFLLAREKITQYRGRLLESCSDTAADSSIECLTHAGRHIVLFLDELTMGSGPQFILVAELGEPLRKQR